jgi:hypothetical protein
MKWLLVLPSAWPDGHGEKLLLAAVIRRAAYDIALYKGSPRLDHKRTWLGAYKWMFEDKDHYFTSFLNICNILNQDPSHIRSKTLRLRREDVRKYELVDAHGRL